MSPAALRVTKVTSNAAAIIIHEYTVHHDHLCGAMFCPAVALSTPSSSPLLPTIAPPWIFLPCLSLTRAAYAAKPCKQNTTSL